MATSRQPRIRIDDLPPLEALTPEEMEAILGAGRGFARLGLEALESRELMTTGINASLSGGVLHIQDSKPNDVVHVRQVNNQISIDGVAIQVGGVGYGSVNAGQVGRISVDRLAANDLVDLDNGVLGGQRPALATGLTNDYLWESGQLFEANSKGSWIDVGGGNSVALDKSGQVFLQRGTELLAASGVASAAFGLEPIWTGVQSLIQGKDTTGNPVAYVLSGNTVYRYPGGTGSPWQIISGHDITQIAVDSTGAPFALGTNGTVYHYPGSGNTWQAIGTHGFVSGDGSIWYLGTGTLDATGDHTIYRLGGNQLIALPGAAANRFLSVQGNAVWAANSTNQVFSWQGLSGGLVMGGPIANKWLQLGGLNSNLIPTGPLLAASDGGVVMKFQQGAQGAVLYWNSEMASASEIGAAIYAKWQQLGGSRSGLVPAGDEHYDPTGAGRVVNFTNGSVIYWSSFSDGTSSAHLMRPGIYAKWEQMTASNSGNVLADDEHLAPDGYGQIITMTSGWVIYWAPQTGAHFLGKGIYSAWQQQGGANSTLGPPVSDEQSISNYAGNNQLTPFVKFQNGGIYWVNGKAITLG